jgi:hypothetical protein
MTDSNYIKGGWLIRCEMCSLVMGYSPYVPTKYICINCYEQEQEKYHDSEEE